MKDHIKAARTNCREGVQALKSCTSVELSDVLKGETAADIYDQITYHLEMYEKSLTNIKCIIDKSKTR